MVVIISFQEFFAQSVLWGKWRDFKGVNASKQKKILISRTCLWEKPNIAQRRLWLSSWGWRYILFNIYCPEPLGLITVYPYAYFFRSTTHFSVEVIKIILLDIPFDLSKTGVMIVSFTHACWLIKTLDLFFRWVMYYWAFCLFVCSSY